MLGLLLATVAFAGEQRHESRQEDCATQEGQEKVTVTGSHIKRCKSDPISPVVIIERDEIERSGASSVADVLRRLPFVQTR